MSVLPEALLHLPDVGPERVKRLHSLGMRSWYDLLGSSAGDLPWGTDRHRRIVEVLEGSVSAMENEDIAYFTRTLARKDQWRILDHWFDRASFFDIETEGVHTGAGITLIACLHRSRLCLFTAGRNLNDFLHLLDEVDLLVSFNGASFDVPKVEDAFCVPALPCAHVDLRWLCYHEGLKGGLKSIEKEMGLERPPDLLGVDGEEAVWLWEAYRDEGRMEALEKLTRYCAADVLSLQVLADRLLRSRNPAFSAILPPHPWAALEDLPGIGRSEAVAAPAEEPPPPPPPSSDLERRMRDHLRRKRERLT